MDNKFEKLDVWRKSHELVMFIYKITKNFPQEERFSLTDQLRRAAVSVAANIVEGNLRNSNKEFLKFMYISKASLEEVKYYLLLSRDLSYISKVVYSESQNLTNDCGRLLSGFIKFLKSRVKI